MKQRCMRLPRLPQGAKPRILYQLEVFDLRTGKVVKRTRKRLVKGFLRNYHRWILGNVQNAVAYQVDTAGTERGFASAGGNANAPDNEARYGIWVGSGTVAVAWEDYTLAAKIAHGTATGQLDYDTHTFTEVSVTGGARIKAVRSFKNLSGADVTVNEIGLVQNIGGYYFLHLRDVLPTSVIVPTDYGLNVIYYIEHTI